jgi:glucose-6-phosphate 1-epimerase
MRNELGSYVLRFTFYEDLMQTTDIQSLNESFAIAEHISFEGGPGGWAMAEIHNAHAVANVSLRGGQALAFQPHGQAPVLWATSHSSYQAGRPIRGGIPICWPWFGPHPTDPSMPAHGFVRTANWNVLSVAALTDGATQIRLRIRDSDLAERRWPYAFDLRCVVTVGAELRVELIIRNPGDVPYTCSGALHSYFNVSDVTAITIHGLDGCDYLDQADGHQRKTQQGPVTIGAETDRLYLDTVATCVIEDPGLGRRIRVAKSGSHTTVVWNPWVEKAQRLADFGAEEYHGMVCVETANAEPDRVTVAPGGEHRLVSVIGVEA